MFRLSYQSYSSELKNRTTQYVDNPRDVYMYSILLVHWFHLVMLYTCTKSVYRHLKDVLHCIDWQNMEMYIYL